MRRLLLIDDDEVFIFLVKKMIENADRTTCIDIFSDGELAIDRLAALANNSEALPDVIFLDLNMPVMDGWSFLDHYSKIYEQFVKKIALYVLSSTITPQDIRRAQDYFVISEFLIKPLDKIKIQQILSRGE